MHLKDLPAVGQPMEGGTFAGLTTTRDGTHCAVVLLDEKPPKRLNFADAMDWAAGLQASLPTRIEAALLYTNCKPLLDPAWHWTRDELQNDTGDEDDASYAWYCGFTSGGQTKFHKSYEGSARAVRLIPLSA